LSKPSEHKTVQARILAYAQEVGWTFVPRAEAEKRRGFDAGATIAEERARSASLYFGDLLHKQVLAFNPKYKEAEGALLRIAPLKLVMCGAIPFLVTQKKYSRHLNLFFVAKNVGEA